MPTPPAQSLLRDALQGVVNLFVGWVLQIGRLVPLLSLKRKVSGTRKVEARALSALGQAMAAADSGDAYLRQKIATLAKSGTARELEQEQRKLGLAGIQAGVPLLTLDEEYRAARRAHETNQATEADYQAAAAQFWPCGPFGWFGLIASYGWLLLAAALLFALLVPDSMPKVLTNWVRPSKAPPPAIAAEYRGVQIVLKEAVIDRGFESTGVTPAKSGSVILRISLGITNTTDQPIRYITWRGHPSRRSSQAYLNDDKGLKLDSYVSNEQLMPVGAVFEATVEPHTTIIDYLDFSTPADNFAHIDLYLPTINLNPDLQSKETLKLEIPRAAVKKPGDVVTP